MAINILMLGMKLTKTVDIDIWNYWHVLLASAMVHYVTGNVWITILVSVIVFILMLKLAEWSAPMLNKFTGMDGICIPHLASLSFIPLALLGNRLIDRIPVLNRIDANPETIRKRLGLLGEPMMLGLLMGIALGIGGGYNLKSTAELAFNFAAVIFILPIMCNILGNSLIPISEGMKDFIKRNFPALGETYIGLDVAVTFGNPSIIVSALLLIPVALILAFILPGINFIPLGDLTNLMVIVAFICIVTNGNVIRTLLIGIPIIIALLYMASNLAGFYSRMAVSAHYQLPGYHGIFTSFLDGGNLFRGWLAKVVTGNPIALAFIPVIAGLLYYTWRTLRKPDCQR
jgi:PTS system galactitol-specific IIC component